MASLVTIADYRRITHDTTTADGVVQPQLDAAEDLVAEYLRRPDRFAHDTYTDRLRLYAPENAYDGAWVAYPIATPVDSVDGGLTVLNARTVAGALPDGGPFLEGFTGQGSQPYATITYAGGWTAGTLPETIRREIAKAARAALTAAPGTVPAGATSVRLGDAAVTFSSGASVGAELTGASKSALRRYMRRRGA